jgi:hypothetical protein
MSKCVTGFEMTPIRGLAFVQIRAGSGHFGSQQPSLVLDSILKIKCHLLIH